MKDILEAAVKQALGALSIEAPIIVLERPADMMHGDFSTNAALVYAKQQKINPVSLAVQIVEQLKVGVPGVSTVEVAGPGFINFYLTSQSIHAALKNISLADKETVSLKSYGRNELLVGKKVAYEYTDPNPFKAFHIGHLMQNTIGESLSRLGEFSGAEVKRFCYQGDVGRHVALTLWGVRFMAEDFPEDSTIVSTATSISNSKTDDISKTDNASDSNAKTQSTSLSEKVQFLGKAYATGAQKFYEAEKAAEGQSEDSSEKKEFAEVTREVQLINKKIYERNDEEINRLYDLGKEWSLEHFEELYEVLGTKFDRYFFESQATVPGIEIVKANTAPNGLALFEESEGAIIFPGEKYGLHTRVFINRFGLPTYEGKEVGLAKIKYEAYQYDKGIVVTASEQDDVFKVTQKVNEMIFPELVSKLQHISHGMLRLISGKMSSRKGDVITGESLLHDMNEMALSKMTDRKMTDEEKTKVSKQVGVAAIKYTVLRQATGKDIIFDPEKSLSFEGDSGPYLQYSCVRARSVLEKAKAENIEPNLDISPESPSVPRSGTLDWAGGKFERLLIRFPETVERAYIDNAPHHIATYLMELAGTFNSFYASTQIIVKDDPSSPYKAGLVEAFAKIMNNGLWLLGIEVPAKM